MRTETTSEPTFDELWAAADFYAEQEQLSMGESAIDYSGGEHRCVRLSRGIGKRGVIVSHEPDEDPAFPFRIEAYRVTAEKWRGAVWTFDTTELDEGATYAGSVLEAMRAVREVLRRD